MYRLLLSFMSMGWDYDSELRLLTGLLFIPQIIYESGQPWWNQRNTEELGENLVPVSLFPPQIPHGLTQARTWASMVKAGD
jgi:hypothetical protein